jgi:hypothetical protein
MSDNFKNKQSINQWLQKWSQLEDMNCFFFKQKLGGRPNTQHNDIQHNDTQHNDIQHNDTQHNDTQHNGIQHNDTQQKGLNCDTQHNQQSKHSSELC